MENSIFEYIHISYMIMIILLCSVSEGGSIGLIYIRVEHVCLSICDHISVYVLIWSLNHRFIKSIFLNFLKCPAVLCYILID